MELRSGYKHTEVGVIPEVWEVKSVRNLGEIKTGPFGTLLKAAEYSGNDGVPLISVGEVGAGCFRINEHTPLVPDVVVRRLPQYVLRQGDIVFGRKGAVDRSAFVTEHEDGWFLGSDGISIRPSKESYPPYLAWQFQRKEIQAWLLQNASGTTMASLNQEILSRVSIPYAPLPEQRAIAAALSDVDALIASLDRLIAKKREMKQAAMQELLTGKRRLAGFSGKWEVRRLGDLGESLIGLTYSPNDVKSDGLLVLRSSNVFEGALRFEDNVFVNKTVPDKLIVRQGDILICARNGSRDLIGKCAMINELAEGMTFGAFMAVFRTSFSRFIFQQFQSDNVKRQIHEHLGATINQITNKSLNSFRIPFPKDDVERDAISTVLSDMDADIAALEQKQDKTRVLKQGMMQELLTGRIRLV